MSTNILFIGATGYLGGPTLLNLLAHPKRSSFEITVLIRDASKAKDFEAYGLRVVIGSLADFNIVEHESAEADFVFQSVSFLGHMCRILSLTKRSRRIVTTFPERKRS